MVADQLRTVALDNRAMHFECSHRQIETKKINAGNGPFCNINQFGNINRLKKLINFFVNQIELFQTWTATVLIFYERIGSTLTSWSISIGDFFPPQGKSTSLVLTVQPTNGMDFRPNQNLRIGLTNFTRTICCSWLKGQSHKKCVN